MLRWGVGVLLAMAPGVALGAGLDFRLNGTRADGTGILFRCPAGSTCGPNDTEFRSFVNELGFVFAPRLMAPADTLGRAGFHVGIGYGGSVVSNEEYWTLTEDGQTSRQPSQYLQTLHLDVRKGLPWSFEVGARLTWLVDSEMMAPGLELRWAFQEGYDFLPDFSLRAAVSTLLGNRDLNLTTLSTDFVLSKSFPVAATVEITPYLGWGVVFTNAVSEVIDPTPTTFRTDFDGVIRPDVENDFVFQSSGLGDDISQKLNLGTRLLVYVVELMVSGELQMFANGQTVGPVGTFNVKLGVTY